MNHEIISGEVLRPEDAQQITAHVVMRVSTLQECGGVSSAVVGTYTREDVAQGHCYDVAKHYAKQLEAQATKTVVTVTAEAQPGGLILVVESLPQPFNEDLILNKTIFKVVTTLVNGEAQMQKIFTR